jgi:hypothetical protein
MPLPSGLRPLFAEALLKLRINDFKFSTLKKCFEKAQKTFGLGGI